MCQYKHLSINERENLLVLRKLGKNISEIAKMLGRSKSTISRELKRNSLNEKYSAAAADEIYHKRRKKSKRHKLLENPELKQKVLTLFLDFQWSPEEISKRLELENYKYKISYNTIYRGIYSGMLEQKKLSHGARGVVLHLRHKGKRRHKKGETETRGKIVISNHIDSRPEEANQRKEIGHWEFDTVLGQAHDACLVTGVDRKSRYLVAVKVNQKASIPIRDAMISMLKEFPKSKVKTITPDRGKEFSKHSEVTEKLNNVHFYFPNPHSPWMRGTNENTNGLLREYFPKGVDFKKFSDKQIADIIYKFNTRPRKCLGWKSPFEIFFGVSLHLT